MSPPLSLRCRLLADRAHVPCSGTTDEEIPRRCGCSCHAAEFPGPLRPDSRLTFGVVLAVFDVLDEAGFVPGEDPHDLARAVLAILRLTRVYEGRDPDSDEGD